MITQDDFNFISRFDTADAKVREGLIRENPAQLAKTFFSLLSKISKDTTLQYLLTLLDDLLQVSLKKRTHFEGYLPSLNCFYLNYGSLKHKHAALPMLNNLRLDPQLYRVFGDWNP